MDIILFLCYGVKNGAAYSFNSRRDLKTKEVSMKWFGYGKGSLSHAAEEVFF